MMECCPACGRPRLKGAVLDYEAGRLMVDGQTIFLSPQQADLMSVFVADPAFTFTAPELADKIWGSRWPADINSSLSGIVFLLRRKLAPTSLQIVAVPGHGYGLRQTIPQRKKGNGQ